MTGRTGCIARGRAWVTWTTGLALMMTPTGVVMLPVPAVAAARTADPCEARRQPFRAIRNYRMGKVIQGALIGMGVGLATEVLRSIGERGTQPAPNGQGSQRGRRIDLGTVVAGGVAGGIVGHFLAARQATADRQALQQAINADYAEDVDQYAPLPQALADLGACRRQQILAVRSQFAAGSIDRRAAAIRLNAIERAIAGDDDLIGKAAKMQTGVIRGYVQESAMVEGADPEAIRNQGDAVLTVYREQATPFAPQVEEQWVDDTGREVPTAVIRYERRYVTARTGAALHVGPEETAAVVDQLPVGAMLDVVPGTSPWVEVPRDGTPAWIATADIGTAPPPAPTRARAGKAARPPVRNAIAARPARRVPPPAGTAVRRLVVRPPARQAAAVSERPRATVARLNAFTQINAVERQAVRDDLRAARALLES